MATKNLIDGLNNFSTNLTSGITAADTTITLDSVTSLPSAQGILVIDRVDSSGTATPAKREYIRYSAVAGSTVTLDSAAVGRGFESSTAQAHSAGAVVEMVLSASHINLINDCISVEHNDAGTHAVVTATSVSTDTISEKTGAAGVTIDGVKLKDSQPYCDVINEKTGAAGVTVDSLLIKDGNITLTDKAPIMNVKARAYLSTDQNNLTDGAWTKVALDTESYDIGADFNTSTNAFVAPVTGYYLITGTVNWKNTIADKEYKAAIYVASAAILSVDSHASLAQIVTSHLSGIFALTAADSVTLYARCDPGASTVDIESGAASTSLSIHLLSVD